MLAFREWTSQWSASTSPGAHSSGAERLSSCAELSLDHDVDALSYMPESCLHRRSRQEWMAVEIGGDCGGKGPVLAPVFQVVLDMVDVHPHLPFAAGIGRPKVAASLGTEPVENPKAQRTRNGAPSEQNEGPRTPEAPGAQVTANTEVSDEER